MSGKKKIFEKAYSKFAEAIVRFTFFKVSDYEEAKDITIEVFTRFWKIINKDNPVKNQKALLFFIAKGIIIDYYRKKARTKTSSLEKIDERFLIQTDEIEETLAKKQEIDVIFQAIRKIKKEYQEILLLRYVEDLKISEISYVLKKNENTIRVVLHRALKAIKEKL